MRSLEEAYLCVAGGGASVANVTLGERGKVNENSLSLQKIDFFMDVYMIRHTSVAVAQGTCYGHTDVPLAETFAAEAASVKERLRGVTFDRVFCSPLSRCRRLAAFCGYGDAVVDERLKEIGFGEWEMRTFDELYAKEPAFVRWCEDYLSQRPPRGESMLDVQARFVDFLRTELVGKPYERVALFCHGGLLSLCEGLRTGVGLTAAGELTMFPYGHVLRVRLEELTLPPAVVAE